MATVFESAIKEAQSMIIGASNSELLSDLFHDKVFKRSAIATPSLDKDKIDYGIHEQVITLSNAPRNIEFISGQKMEFAFYKIPIKGDIDLFQNIVGFIFNDEMKFINSGCACYKEFSKHRITGNEQIINQIKLHAKVVFDMADKRLAEFSTGVDQFNEEKLKPMIQSFILIERKKRKDKSDSEQKLNPFI